jgi:flavodoxin
MSTLVVYYSRTGTTRNVAETIARTLGSDIEAIRESRDRFGRRGYLRSALDASLCRQVPVRAMERDPTRYDLVVIGTPVWYWSLSAPVRSFLASYSRWLPKVAFFCTEGGGGDRRVFGQMSEVAEVVPLATLALLRRDVESGDASRAVDAFVESLPKKAPAAPEYAHRAH